MRQWTWALFFGALCLGCAARPDPAATAERLPPPDVSVAQVQQMLAALNSPKQAVRLNAVRALARIPSPQARAALERAAADTDPAVREAAKKATANPRPAN